jgi:hypothetical protein
MNCLFHALVQYQQFCARFINSLIRDAMSVPIKGGGDINHGGHVFASPRSDERTINLA